MGKPGLDIETERIGNVTVLKLSGPVDSQTFDIFKAALHEACSHKGAHVLLDCRELSYMNSKSFGLLSQQHRQLLAGMGLLGLCCLNRKLVKTMDLLGLGQMLKIFETREEALEELS